MKRPTPLNVSLLVSSGAIQGTPSNPFHRRLLAELWAWLCSPRAF